MNDSLWVAIVNGLVLVALAWIDARSKARSLVTQQKVDKLAQQTDGMKTELVEAVKKAAHAEGKIEEMKNPTAPK